MAYYNSEIARLNAERNLRFAMDNYGTNSAKPEELANLDKLCIESD